MSKNSINVSKFFMKSIKFIKQADDVEEGQAVLACNKFVFLLSALSACCNK